MSAPNRCVLASPLVSPPERLLRCCPCWTSPHTSHGWFGRLGFVSDVFVALLDARACDMPHRQ
eukprot:scaffold221425_cov32-Tisochrysis_lutea.AAC.1